MKHFLILLSIAVVAASCLSEKDAKPGNAGTFIRYFSGGYNDQAVTVEQTSDGGYALLTNSKIQASDAEAPVFRIKLIKTDEMGTVLWETVLNDETKSSYKAADLALLSDGGYVITGSKINTDSTGRTFLMIVDTNGKLTATSKAYHPAIPGVDSTKTKYSFDGQAVTINAAGDYVVLSTSLNANMHLTEFKKSDFSVSWMTTYAAGKTTLTNSVYLDEAGKYLWSGTVTKSADVTGVRMVKTAPKAINTDFDLTLVNPGYSETASSFCKYGFGYAVIGTTNQKKSGAGDLDIMFKRLASDGTVLSTMSFPTSDTDNANDNGNSISSTQDGGLILLGTVPSGSINGRGEDDYMLIKVDAFGNEVWRQHFGSRFKDTGVAVRQSSDGGFIVLGTTTQGQMDIVMLAKTDKNGKIE